MERVFQLLSATGTVLGAWALIRTYVLSHPKLVLIQQHRWGKNYLGFADSQARIGISVLVTNPRPQANAVVDWTAQVRAGNRFVDVPVPSGVLQGLDSPTPFGVLPLSVPAFGAAEASICLSELPSGVKSPVTLKLIAKDVFGKTYRLQCVITEGPA
jgi:hypothetical protein